MLTALALTTILGVPTTVELLPSDDIFVYPHASDPAKGDHLCVWGAGGRDVAKDSGDIEQYGYGYFKFDLSKVPAGKLSGATLTVTHFGHPGYDVAYVKQNPLKARPLSPDFSEKTWNYSKTEQIAPEAGDKAAFGSGYPATIPAGDQEFTIIVNLLNGPNDFKAYLEKARASSTKALAFALTSSVDVLEMGQSCIYKFYSKDCDAAAKRPVLRLTIS
jgi:hypothetical protein